MTQLEEQLNRQQPSAEATFANHSGASVRFFDKANRFSMIAAKMASSNH